MHETLNRCRLPVALLVLALLGGCGTLDKLFPDRSQDYKKAKPAAPLDVPPDLVTTTLGDALVVGKTPATLSGYTSAQQRAEATGTAKVLPKLENIRLERDGDRMWLVVPGDPEAVWNKAREFWLEQGFLIEREDPVAGYLETNWVENRAAIPKGIIRGVISRVFDQAYSSAFRDRYRMRLERGEQPGTTEVYITHQGLEEQYQGDANDVATTKWFPRPSDPALESAMLKHLMVYLGVPEARAAEQVAGKPAPRAARAELVREEGEGTSLLVYEDYARAWRSVGVVLDRVGFAVEDRDRAAGIYYVRYNDPLKGQNKGLLSKLAFWSRDEHQPDRYRIKLLDEGTATRVRVQNEAGEPERSKTAERILTLLYEQLR